MLGQNVEPLMQAIGEAAAGLLFPSESDFPIEAYRFGEAEPAPAAVLRARGLPPDTPVEEVSVASFFEGLVEGDDDGAARFRALVDLLQRELSDLRVYRVGKVDIDAFVLGRHPSGVWLGITTKLVET
ncbi:nuclease A inhibitor family protein [Polyangium jinanense]|uniref:Nuclease A inhibitor family protein n=1 Tax=Polyangium jinanense TaxID=2829994 RepID=A0A9X3XG85_9BACT|nr:nuclease A inhibitor family protein [Polyangium jinanense]MDC3961620.1 nuclease A inhibitor family protein [Polyangium jinanense]MDC3988158.1 nuclease A inhibitor family protein [Polyangium jinanense]